MMDQHTFTDLFREDCIIDNLDVSSREEALAVMAEHLVSLGFCHHTFPQAILDRERVYPSGLPFRGYTIAIPHTDVVHVRQSVILVARLPVPVLFQSMGAPEDVLPVQLISMFALKEREAIGDLLETLITVYQREHALTALIQASDRFEMFRILKTMVLECGSCPS